ncbi:MAG: threonine/serine exporter family protein [Peptoniphilus lacydonensis]|uniref:threonine/serine ThrE exporter family protein n=1 Tax=Peptoniphilus TaxID=162289 RepID=UPI0002895960|nr:MULTISPECIES: threonine/serine exporter family protein [Peptoniphilus]MDU1954197.1 threonine/serine exporter family protein [Peptoniphilus lacydonensis]MDU5274627.1 threonine/serine exporter family protein [Peptoniphilus lacydonensis]MDU5595594.1 threonine/serine exporter family protein [Peptoniphilus rhinitidis]
MAKVLNNIKEAKDLMNLSLYTGALLIQNGAESYRAEDTIERICKSVSNISNVSAYALPSAIFISMEFEGETLSNFRKITIADTNLYKIDRVNSFSREFVSSDFSIKEAYDKLFEIDNTEEKEEKIYLSGGIAASFFSVLFGGDLKDFFASFFIGILIPIILDKLSHFKLSFFINNIICAFITSILAITFVHFNFGSNIDNIIIGVIMLLVPGVAITNSVRDIMSGEFITGAITMIKAFFIALAIAFGVGVGLKIMRFIL